MNKKAYKVTLGGVIVWLCNRAGVDEKFLDEIFSKSELDSRELLLILNDKDRLQYRGTRKMRAWTLPSFLLSSSFPDYNFYSQEIERMIDLQQCNECDAVVYVCKTVTEKWEEYGTYFAFVLGHELEHVKVIRENREFHMYATWLCNHTSDIFEKVGSDLKSKKTWNFPLELHCNRKGKKLAISIFGKEKFNERLKALRENETSKHKEYLTFIMKELEGEPYTKNICKSICCDIIKDYYNNKSLKEAAHNICEKNFLEKDVIVKQFNLKIFLPLD